MSLIKWQQGRQNTGYFKKLVFASKRLGCDCYLLKFEPGVEVPWHFDPVSTGRKHYRFNLYLKRKSGGELVLDGGKPLINNRWFHLFRPDIQRHRMTKVEDSTIYILSIGWLR